MNTIKKIAIAASIFIASYLCDIPPVMKYATANPAVTEQTQYQGYDGLENKLGAYFTTDEHETEIKRIAKENPEITSLEEIGETWHKRPIYMIKISDKNNVIEETGKKEPQTIIIAQQHAKELISGTTALALAEHLIKNYNIDPKIKKYVNNNEVYIIPLANPDGLAIVEGSFSRIVNKEKAKEMIENYPGLTEEKLQDLAWRKNARDNNDDGLIVDAHDGVDINRNYYTGQTNWEKNEWADNYSGPEPFSEPETKAVKSLVERLDNLVIAVDLHSFGGLVVYPPGCKLGESEDQGLYEKIAKEMVEKQPNVKYDLLRMNMMYEKNNNYGVIMHGTFADWVYNNKKALSFIIELYKETPSGFGDITSFNPQQQNIKQEVENVLPMILHLLEISDTIKKP